MPPATILRLVIDGPQSGPCNMAADEAILLAVNEGLAPPLCVSTNGSGPRFRWVISKNRTNGNNRIR